MLEPSSFCTIGDSPTERAKVQTLTPHGKQGAPLSQAVVWRSADGELYRGRIDVDDRGLRLAGTGPEGGLRAVSIPYDELAGIHIGRAEHERVNGLRTLIVQSDKEGPIHLASLEGMGAIFEIGALLAELRAQNTALTTSVAVVVPLKAGRVEHARALVREGPPFDPAVRFECHHVFVSEREAVFVFEGEDVKRAVEQLARVPAVWKAAAAWSECVEGPPRIAEEGYAWPCGDDDVRP
jgi:hypothetical protein